MIREALVDVKRVARNPWAIGLPLLAYGVFLSAVAGDWWAFGVDLVIVFLFLWLAWRWHVRMWGEEEADTCDS